MLILKNIILLQSLSYFVFARQVFFQPGMLKNMPDFLCGSLTYCIWNASPKVCMQTELCVRSIGVSDISKLSHIPEIRNKMATAFLVIYIRHVRNGFCFLSGNT